MYDSAKKPADLGVGRLSDDPVYCGEHIFKQLAPDTIEQPGSFYSPLLGALITSGGRLLLAMIERCVRDAGGTYLCCDTDALIIVASKAGGTIQLPDGASPDSGYSQCKQGESLNAREGGHRAATRIERHHFRRVAWIL